MKSSGISSATALPTPSSAPSRKAFALTGRSATLDPATNAVRADLADVRLAELVFAPHYAAPMPRVLTIDSELREARAQDSSVIVMLNKGDAFEVLDLIGEAAWGIAPGNGLVGYLPAAALGKPSIEDVAA
ncbi:SH3 domain-containing protein [Sphingomonas mollis]|uniref:SH3 domain-containing protein n=1 Tax=Sphingomonas mollis TaxID=2795726 RepID=UPI002FCE145B